MARKVAPKVALKWSESIELPPRNLGTVPLEAADYKDYMVRVAVVRGSTTKGYFAFDNVVFLPSGHCEVYPPHAKPPDILGTDYRIRTAGLGVNSRTTFVG